jgi:hypothetical protein
MPIILLPVVLAVLLVVAFRRHHDAPGRARAVRRIAFGFMALYVVLAGLFIAGETFSDPGGWAAVGWVASWLVPMVGLSLLAWFRPDGARIPLTVLTGATVALAVWYAFESHAWRTFENAHGPVRGIAVFALGAALAVYGYRRPRLGGMLLLVATAVPVAMAMLASGGFGMASLGALALPAMITGALFVWSSAISGSAPPPDAPGPAPPPAAAATTRP